MARLWRKFAIARARCQHSKRALYPHSAALLQRKRVFEV